MEHIFIQKYINVGEKIIPIENDHNPVAIAMNNFEKGDIGVFNYNVIYPISFRNRLIMLPGLKKCNNKQADIIKKGLMNDKKNKKTKKTR